MHSRRVLLTLLGVLALAACSSGGTTASTPSAPPATTPLHTSTPPRQAVVVLDPGHNGGNASAAAAINRHVPAGRGRTKPCNTTGTSTDAGYPEHAFNFDVAQRTGRILSAEGIRVVFTRDADDEVGPCVDERAAIGNAAEADAVVSIHADGAAAGARGFHVAYSAPPLNTAQGQPARRLADALVSGLADAGFPVADYIGAAGLSARDDLAGLNLSERPAALVECGNMRNATEAAAMSTPEGRQRYAEAIAAGTLDFLGR